MVLGHEMGKSEEPAHINFICKIMSCLLWFFTVYLPKIFILKRQMKSLYLNEIFHRKI